MKVKRTDRAFVSYGGLSFDDVLLVPRKSDVLPCEADTSTRLTKKLSLHIPVMSAAMDRVTEAEMAIALAREGGIGVMHRNLSIEEQVANVRKVKHAESTVIHEPICLTIDRRMEDALAMMEGAGISGVPIINEQGTLQGILTRRDLRGVQNWQLPVTQRMIKGRKLIKAQADVSIEDAEALMDLHRIEKLPLVNQGGKLCGLITRKDIESRRKFPHAIKDSEGRLLVAAAVGTGEEAKERVAALAEEEVDILVIDSAHGHSQHVLDMLAYIKKFCSLPVVAGNIVTHMAACEFAELGADALKVGVGPASICTTRIVTGCGMPQLTAIFEVASVAKKYGIPVIADGGICYSGDITKALAAGADVVMLGNLLSGCDEAPSKTVMREGRTYKEYRGMGCEAALQERGSLNRYGHVSTKAVPEGVEALVTYKGSVKKFVGELMGGLRAGMGMCGAHTIAELQRYAKFVRITPASLQESHAHDVMITNEPSNYSRS